MLSKLQRELSNAIALAYQFQFNSMVSNCHRQNLTLV